MRTVPPPLLPLFRSHLQAELLAALFLGDGEPMTTAALQARTQASRASLHRELGRLEAAALIDVERVGRSKRYSAATQSPLHDPLRELLERSLGVEKQLLAQLAALPGVEHAAIFGSWAAEQPSPRSDIDLIVVGHPTRDDLLAALRKVETAVGREIDVVTYEAREFRDELRRGSGFLATLLEGPLTPLVGDLRSLS